MSKIVLCLFGYAPRVVECSLRVGVWAVTRSTVDRRWQLNHAPSGAMLTSYGTRTKAHAAARALVKHGFGAWELAAGFGDVLEAPPELRKVAGARPFVGYA